MKKQEDSSSSSSSSSEQVFKNKRKVKKAIKEQNKLDRSRTRDKKKISYHQEIPSKMKILDQRQKLQIEAKQKKQQEIQQKYLLKVKNQKQNNLLLKKYQQLPPQKIEVVQYAFPEQELLLKMTKGNLQKNKINIKILQDSDRNAQSLIVEMDKALKEDSSNYKTGKMAYNRIRLLSTIRQLIQNVYTKRKFVQKGGLDWFFKWMMPLKDHKNRLVEPCIAVKMGLLRILRQLQLDPSQINEYGASLTAIISKNRENSKIIELKDICREIMESWDYTIFRQFNSQYLVKK